MNDDRFLIEQLLSDSQIPTRQADGDESAPRQHATLEARRITDEMPGGFFIYHAGGDEEIIYANKALFRIFNCQSMEEFRQLTGGTFPGMVHPDDLEGVQASIREQIANSQYDLDYVEYRIFQKGGAMRWVEDYGHFIHSDFAGDVFYVFIGDATEKHLRMQQEKDAFLQTERSLQSQIDAYGRELEVINQEQLRRLELIDGLSVDYDSIFYVNTALDVFQPYRASERIRSQLPRLGEIYSFQQYLQLVQAYMELWVHPEDRGLFARIADMDYIAQRLSERKTLHINYRILRGKETEYLQLCLVKVGNSQVGTQLVLGCRSIDEEIRQRMEQARILEAALNQMKASNKVKDTFLSNMSHDIRTPMNAIIGFAAIAKSHLKDSDKLLHFLKEIETSGNQLLQLLDDVLELSRLESDKLHSVEVPCDLADIARQIHAGLLPLARQREQQFRLHLEGLEHPLVHADSQHLTQVLTQVADNAIKYTPNGGSIDLTILEQRTSHGFATYQFIARDTGIGISEDFLSHIFEPFERQRNTTLSGVQGAGLGLAIVKNIVEMMGGTVTVSSQLGQGSCFTITLTLRLQEEDAPPPAPEAAALRGRILLVEDNELNMEIEQELLTDAGFSVDTAADGSIAVEKVRQAKPGDYSLILMDIQMPVMDGYEATRAIRALPDPALAGLPIVALSANAFEEDRRKSMESGMDGHLAKPIHISQLVEFIENITGNH